MFVFLGLESAFFLDLDAELFFLDPSVGPLFLASSSHVSWGEVNLLSGTRSIINQS